MKNLTLQGEVRHALPLPFRTSHHTTATTNSADVSGEYISGNIVAVIQNPNNDFHIGTNFDNHYHDGRDAQYDHPTDEEGSATSIKLSKQPPANFVVTSDGKVLAMDSNDQLVWLVDLEKVVDEANDDEEEGEEGAVDTSNNDDVPKSRSLWFYAASFIQETSPDMLDDKTDGIMGMDLNDEGGLHLTCLSHAGHVVSVSIDTTASLALEGGNVEEGSEYIGTFENGLECGGWSPDGEVLALVTFANDEGEEGNAIVMEPEEAKVPILMTMNTQYEILAEVRLDPCLFALRDIPAKEAIEPHAISFCWRPDSSSLAVSTMDVPEERSDDSKPSPKPLRRIRTYNRTTLDLLSVSKEEDGSGRDVPNLLPVKPTWAPAGCSHYVGAVQSSRPLTSTSARGRQGTLQVAFLEPNGLRHRECKIHNTGAAGTTKSVEKEEVTVIAFNLEGDLLAVTILVSSTDQSPYGKVQLYHRNNYHWYLKYELRYYDGETSSVVSSIKFSDEDPYQVMVALHRRDNLGQASDTVEWREYMFRWESSTVYYRNKQSGKSSSVLAMAVDGKTLNFTPLDKAIVPPPMYASSLALPAPVVSVSTRPSFYHEKSIEGESQNEVEFIASMSDGRFAMLGFGGAGCKGNPLTPGFSPPLLLAVVDSRALEGNQECGEPSALGSILRDITIIDSDDNSLTVVAVTSPEAASGKHSFVDNLIELKVSINSQADTLESNITMTMCLPLEGRALRVINWSDTAHAEGARGNALVQLTDGSLLEYSRGGVIEPSEAGHLLEPCPWISGLYDANIDSTSTSSRKADNEHVEPSKRLVIGLASRFRLYCGERLLSNASSSFDISLQHRFLTHVTLGSRPQLRFIPLAVLRDFDPLMGSDENMALDGYEPRNVERGARLVAIFPTTPSVVLQMPRGNLESISPRALVLPFIMLKIRSGDYHTSLDIMRRQRVDMNLVVDFDPVHFLEQGGAEQFVGQIERIDHINLFLSGLIDVDTTLWKYPVPSWIKTADEFHRVSSIQSIETPAKVNNVCAKMREVMLEAERSGTTPSGKIVKDGHFLLPILSTFAKESPPKLQEALSLIKQSAVREQLKNPTKKLILLSDRVQSSIQYLAFLADYSLIFDTAIGIYDFDLAKAVARHSQMDPKVYLPMLKRWKELPESTARFEVDVKLKRYESALRHLVASGEAQDAVTLVDHYQKCIEFIEAHGLHKLGLQLFDNDETFSRSIMVSLGERLITEKNSQEALTVFLASSPKHLDGAKRAARACGDWKAYFACCDEGNETVDCELVATIAESISSKMGSMQEQRKGFADAARILLDYGQDVAYAIDMYISGHMWSEGRRIAHMYKRSDLAKKCVDASASYANTCIDDLAERAQTFEKTNDRYAEVIVLRRDAIKEAEETGVDPHLDDSASLFSMQSTASNSSLRSTASGSSMGSIGSRASVSTVISVGAKSTFSITGDLDNMRHKSKFNQIGRDKKKARKKKKGPNSRKTKPGSEEELNELIVTMQNTCPDEHYVAVIGETITFLFQSGKQPLARLLFEAYNDLESIVARSQTARIDRDAKEMDEKRRKARKEGLIDDAVEHPCEKNINAICSVPLSVCVQNISSYLI